MSQCNKKVISTDNAPKAIGPYSQGIVANGFLFISGQIAINPKTGNLVSDSFNDQVKQVLENIKEILKASALSLDDVVKTTVFISDIKNFGIFNEIYAEYFGESKPARSLVEVSNLPKGALVEIEVIAKN